MGLKSHYPSGTSGLIPFDIPYTYRQRVCLGYWRAIGGNINRVCVNDTKDTTQIVQIVIWLNHREVHV